MLQITSDQVTPKLRSFFQYDEPQGTRCLSVLVGNERGKIFTNDAANPTWGVVQEEYDGCIYLGGALDIVLVAQMITALRVEGDVIIGMWPDDPRFGLLPAIPKKYDHTVLEFYDRPMGEGLDPYLENIPEECELRRMDRELVMLTQWGADDVQYTGGIEAWEAKCMGFCLMQGEELLSEASVGPGADGLREPGFITQEAHRSQGYGTLVMARLIQEIEALGDRTYWNCTKHNLPSAAVARKLGYRVEKEYRLVGWEKVDS